MHTAESSTWHSNPQNIARIFMDAKLANIVKIIKSGNAGPNAQQLQFCSDFGNLNMRGAYFYGQEHNVG